MAHEHWPWLALILLGAYHGLNPAMGWLFAVGLGLQEGRREAVLKAFWPIALGHAAAVTLVVAAVLAAQVVVPLEVLKYAGAGALILFGLYKLIRRKHPRWVGMRVGFRDLTAWSFLMASAHGAGQIPPAEKRDYVLLRMPLLLQVRASQKAPATVRLVPRA
jgi:threonine/homoserine/homoserine lactone efflux protein